MESNKIGVIYYKHPVYNYYAYEPITDEIYSLKNNQIRLLKQVITRFPGYSKISVYKDKKAKNYYVHRFVWECYYNEILDKNIDIDHRDRNLLNNHISNLRKVTRATNNLNKYTNVEVHELPEDNIEVIKYNKHYFEDLYFSPLTDCLYKISDGYIFKIPFKTRKRVQIYDKNKKLTSIYLNKLIKIIKNH